MPYDFIIQEEKDIIRVIVSGDRTPGKEVDDAIELITEITKASIEKGLNRVLAIWKVKGELPVMQAWNLGNVLDSSDLARNIKLATVNLDLDSRRGNVFTENVVVNRGYNWKVFDNEEVAKSWLLESSNT